MFFILSLPLCLIAIASIVTAAVLSEMLSLNS